MPKQETAALRQTYRRVSRGLWQWCSQRGASLILLLVLALALAVSYTFPQTPAHIRSDPKTYQEWISTIQVKYKNWTAFLDAVGLFGVRDTAWYRVLLALTAFVSLVSLGNHLGRLAGVQVKQPRSFYETPGTLTWDSKVPLVEMVDRVKSALDSLHLRVRTETDGETTYLCGTAKRWTVVVSALVQLGALLVAIGLAVTARWGWDQQGVQLLPGVATVLGPEGNHSVKLSSTSAPLDEAVLELDGHQALVTVENTRCRGMLDCQLTEQSGPLVQVSAQRVDKTPIQIALYAVRPEPSDSLQFTFSGAARPNETDRLFLVPDHKLVVRLKWMGLDEQQAPRFYQWVFRQGGQELVGEERITTQDGSGKTQIGDVVYHWHVSRHITVDFGYRPGRLTSNVGTALIVLGLLGQLAPQQQVWSMVQSQNGRTVVRIRQEKNRAPRQGQQREDTWATLRAEIEAEQ